jgi:hypothetical protein
MTIGKRLIVLLAVPLAVLLVSGILARIQPSKVEERGRFAEFQLASVAVLERLQAALGDFDVSAVSSALADLEGVALSGSVSDLARLRNHVEGYECDEARALASRLLEQIGSEVS